jgi:murein DD-endopeptidase MepM/ murein hydrolase activator NlpD
VRRLALLSPLLAVLAFGSARAGGTAHAPTASGTAWAIKVSVPNQGDLTSATASSPPQGAPAAAGRFSYPADGSIVAVQSVTAAVSTTVATNAGAKAESDATGISLFAGELQLDSVTARASAGTGYSGAGGNFLGSQIVNLTVGGHPTVGPRVTLGDWGVLTIGAQAVDRTAPPGTRGYHGQTTELDLRLTAAHGGLPAGSRIQIGFAEAAAQTAPRQAQAPLAPPAGPPVGDAPRLWPRSSPTPSGPLRLHPKLAAGRYVFPVYGPSSFLDTFGVRAGVSYHHGDDILGQLGQPLVACADGTVFSLGWNASSGNRLWIRDTAGNEFSYAHLAAFSTLVANGAHVRAGQLIGFMGNTGASEGATAHLHFEVHPVSLLYLGYDGAVDPTPYLAAWQHARDLPFLGAAGWAPLVPGGASAPEPGAMLLGMSDISSADGLDPASLRKALLPPKQLLQTLVPTGLPATAKR